MRAKVNIMVDQLLNLVPAFKTQLIDNLLLKNECSKGKTTAKKSETEEVDVLVHAAQVEDVDYTVPLK